MCKWTHLPSGDAIVELCDLALKEIFKDGPPPAPSPEPENGSNYQLPLWEE